MGVHSRSYACMEEHSFTSVINSGVWWDPSSPYYQALLLCNSVSLLVFLVSSVSGNYSQVDKLWSILPAVYAWMCVADDRTTLMACLSTLWAARLTFNFHRRGGYAWPPWRGDEDYRWAVLRDGSLGGWWKVLTNKWAMVVFNFTFISFYQNYLLLAIASPSLVAWSRAMDGVHCSVDGASPLNFIDGIACTLFVTFWVIEARADKQQHTFQNGKKEWKSRTGKGGAFAAAFKKSSAQISLYQEYKDGFCECALQSLNAYLLSDVMGSVTVFFNCKLSYSHHSKANLGTLHWFESQRTQPNRQCGYRTTSFR